MDPESLPEDAQSLAKWKEVTEILYHVSEISISIEKELGLRELLKDESLLLYLNSWSFSVSFSEADWQSILLCHKVLGSCGASGPHSYPTWLQHAFDSPSVGKNSLGAKVKVKQALLTKRRCCRLFSN